MKISKRLEAVASFVNSGSFILDIGCDHALLDIYLVLNQKDIRVIASDRNEKPLEKAKENIAYYNLQKLIALKKGDGLDTLEPGVDTIVLSGLGTNTILNILLKDKRKLNHIKKIIISSNNHHEKLRKILCDNSFKIADEKLIIEKDKYYPIIVFVKGKEHYSKLEMELGPVLIKKNTATFKKFIHYQMDKLIEINKKLTGRQIFKKIRLHKKIRERKRLL